MKSINTLYEGKEAFQSFLSTTDLRLDEHCLVRVYVASGTGAEAVEVAVEIKQLLPNAQLIGASGSGIIFRGEQRDTGILVILESFETATVVTHTHTFSGKSPALMAREVADTLSGQPIPLAHLLCGGHYPDIFSFVEEFNKLNTVTRLVGGVVGDILPENTMGFVFTEAGVIEDGIVTAAYCGQELYRYCRSNIAHTPISTYYRLDRSQDGLLLEIEGKPGADWCREQFGLVNLNTYDDWQRIATNDELLRFPIIIKGHGGASRFLRYDTTAQELSLYFSKLEAPTLFRIGYVSPLACVQSCFEICNSILEVPVESLFCYSCLFRKMYLSNCAEWELRPFHQYNLCGTFTMGEVGSVKGKNEFLNGACCFAGIADRPVFMNPDLTVFEDLYKIKDDDQRLLNFVLQKQSSAMSQENERLLQQVLDQQECARERLYRDCNTGIPNSVKFAQDSLTRHFNKLCLVQVENAPLLIAKLGQERYSELILSVDRQVLAHLQTTCCGHQLARYTLNSNTFFFVVDDALSDAKFMEMAQEMYQRYQFIKPDGGADILINRFVVALHQRDLLLSALTTLQSGEGLQTRFLVSGDSTADSPVIGDELERLHLLNEVIMGHRVIPYFQGIYDNEAHCITRYEALMRIEDDRGNIYAPGHFMDIAKKYHMYIALSKQMMEQVFSLFGGREETVSINLSAHDINLDEMQTYIFSLLEQVKNAKNFVFEILEDEDFQDMERLKTFIAAARCYGVRIAIDDFGSGYSNFMEVIKLEPDYIKVDIGIVRNIDSDPIHRKVLQNIVFLGRQMGARLVAEGVETQEIQARIESMGVRYSQGFLFARPSPYTELKLG